MRDILGVASAPSEKAGIIADRNDPGENAEKTTGTGLTFVLYPDGGQVYDTLTRSWSKEKLSAEEWAQRMIRLAKSAEGAICSNGDKVWGGVVVGGCCKTSYEEIKALREEIDRVARTD